MKNSYWDQFPRTKCYPNKCNCEQMNIDSLIIQPASTFSNLPIVMLALYILFKNKKNHKLFSLGLLILLAGIGSIILHMSFTRLGQILDFSGIGFVFSWIFFYYYVPKKYFNISLILLICSSYILIYLSESSRYPLVISLGLVSLLTFIKNEIKGNLVKNKRILISIAIFLIGILLFVLDNKRVWCPQIAWFQGHTIWHLIVAFTMYEFYSFFKEKELNLERSNF